jgi:hypothetical protein
MSFALVETYGVFRQLDVMYDGFYKFGMFFSAGVEVEHAISYLL